MMCPTCGGAMLTERPHRHSATDRTPSTAAGRAMYAKWGHHNFVDEWNATILAIEDEARAPLEAEIARLRAIESAARRLPAPDLDAKRRRYTIASDEPDFHALRAALEEPTP